MAKRQGKRAAATPLTRKAKKQRVYRDVPDLTEVAFTAIEPMNVEMLRKSPAKDNLRLAEVYGFLNFSTNLPELDIGLVSKFLMGYNINDGSSVVDGRRILLTESLLNKALYLPISELGVGDAKPPPDFNPAEYFKTGLDALEEKQGWKTAEAIRPGLVEWMRFAQKRLVLGVHATYLAQKYLYAVTQTFNGMKFNWALFVVERIYHELQKKRFKGRFGTLLGASYISVAVRYQLNQPLTESDEEMAAERETPTPTEKEAAPIELQDPSEGEPEPARKTTQQYARLRKMKQTKPGKFKQHVMIGLEQVMEWVSSHEEEPDQSAELADLRKRSKQMQDEYFLMTKAMAKLKKEKEEAEKERDLQAGEVKREQDRNAIAHRTWEDDKKRLEDRMADEKKSLEDRMKASQVEHQEIKDDLDNQLSTALRENLKLRDTVRGRENELRQLELAKPKEKSVVSVGVQTESLGSAELDAAALRRRIGQVEELLASLGRYNQELLEKYEPESESSDDEEEDTGDADSEEGEKERAVVM
ncbi:hypothetical protein KC19_8G003300 [Ceratodon purpureus]|uniref:Uncharacterized protein n=1 Tax=Ceratodon purpureus TaxID=3225 RepID=A0A8T0GXC2_CERPU|nr:hypothetical protein KC19_8G003300 [Ceratodon purpureus]